MRKKRVSVIVLASGASKNVPVCVRRIHSSFSNWGIPYEVIVVSSDCGHGMPEACEKLSRCFSVVGVVADGVDGTSGAVIEGMKAASGDLLVVMSVDFPHPVEAIVSLLDALEDPKVDFAVGSRFGKSGSMESRRGFFCWLNSKIVSCLIRSCSNLKDPLWDIFALRRETFESRKRDLNPAGNQIGLELMVKCGCRHVVERSILGSEQFRSDGKVTVRGQINYLRHMKRLFEYRFREWAYLSQFLVVGASGVIVDLGVFRILLICFSMPVSRVLAIWGAMTWNFLLNYRFTFSYARQGAFFKQYVGYCLSCSLGSSVNWSVSVLLIESFEFFSAWRLLAAMVGIVLGTAFNYLLCRHVVFRMKKSQR